MRHTFILLLTVAGFSLHGQNPFEEVLLNINDTSFTWTDNVIIKRGQPHLYFQYLSENPEVELVIYPRDGLVIESVEVQNSEIFQIQDSVVLIDDFFRTRLRFSDLSNRNFVSILFQMVLANNDEPVIYELKLQPLFETKASFNPDHSTELFIGEEKSMEIVTNNASNLRLSEEWQQINNINYRLRKDGNRVFIHLIGNQLGTHRLELNMDVKQPYLQDNELLYEHSLGGHSFTVKPARTSYINTDTRMVILKNTPGQEDIEIEVDYHRQITLEKTYRIEAQEKEGGRLKAELFTREILSNGRVLCWLRVYDFHSRSDGYLYIKDGDQVRFITNFDIVHETQIDETHILREGGEWQQTTEVYPGETIQIKLNGIGLNRGDFQFDGLSEVQPDTVTYDDDEIRFTATVPVDILNRRVNILHNGEATGSQLTIKEFASPRDFDYIFIRVGSKRHRLSESGELILTKENLQDIFIEFDRDMIDEGQLNGPQSLEIELTVRNADRNLLDSKTIRNVKIKPENSPRTRHYSDANFTQGVINLNQYLSSKIFQLDDWATIEIQVRHDNDDYSTGIQSKAVNIVLSTDTSFDVDVSFPAGLVIKKIGEDGFGNLGGISMAMIAQFSFYKEGRINERKPYQIGAGFLALNAFNFSDENDDRDVGIVVLGSVYPIRSRKKLSFPLYMGSGYFLSDQKWFWLIGPGIRLSL
ncbi:MAG: hypothetical protein RJQ09_18910 [Cyclobacteriaceae bacterium]